MKKIGRALRRSGGNMKQAAEKLKIPRRELIALVHAEPALLDQALEASERVIDKAEAALRQAMREAEPLKAMAAASAIVRTSRRWRKLPQTGE